MDVKLLLKKEKMIDYKKQGKKNREAGARFELKVRKDLESKGWIVDKWSNNVEFETDADKQTFSWTGKLVSAKHKFRGIGIPMAIGTGFPDFIIYRRLFGEAYEIAFVECKTNGYLSQIEKEKAKWYLENKLCSKFFIAYKTKIKNRVKVEYKTFELK